MNLRTTMLFISMGSVFLVYAGGSGKRTKDALQKQNIEQLHAIHLALGLIHAHNNDKAIEVLTHAAHQNKSTGETNPSMWQKNVHSIIHAGNDNICFETYD